MTYPKFTSYNDRIRAITIYRLSDREGDKMPAFPVPSAPATILNFNMSLISHRGETASVGLTYDSAVTDAELETLANSLGAVSNAGLYAYQKSEKTGISPVSAVTLDEAEASVATKAELVFIDNALRTRSISVPAPDAQFIGADGFTIKNEGGMLTLINAVLTVLNGGSAGTGTFAFARGYVVDKARKGKRGNIQPVMREPLVTDAPSDAPEA